MFYGHQIATLEVIRNGIRRCGSRRVKRSWRDGILALLVALLLGAVATLMISPRLAEQFVFFPSRMAPGPPPVLAGVPGMDVWLTASDGVRLQGWWFAAGEDAPILLFFHGNAGHIGDREPIAEGLVARGLTVFLLDYRGYGRSAGRPTEAGLHLDAQAAHAFAAARATAPSRLVVLGESLGAAVAARLAAERPVSGLVLSSAFTDLADMAAAAYPFLPHILFRRLRGHFDTRGALAHLHAPVLVVHGTRDEIVPFRMGRELFERARGPKAWFPVEGAGHNDVFLVGGDAYFERIARFAREVARGPDLTRE